MNDWNVVDGATGEVVAADLPLPEARAELVKLNAKDADSYELEPTTKKNR